MGCGSSAPVEKDNIVPRSPASTHLTRTNFIQKTNGNSLDFYEKKQLLNEGSFGRVYLIEKKTEPKDKRALKRIPRQQIEEQNKKLMEIERNILSMLDHPNIVKIYETYENDVYYDIITELLEGEELLSLIDAQGNLDQTTSAHIMSQILLAVNYAHNHQVVHRDLQLENVMVQYTDKKEFIIKIIDWGSSVIIESSKGKNQLQEFIGSSLYIAPDVIKKSYNEKCDIWSCGVMLYIMLTGQPPFKSTGEKLKEEILTKEPVFDSRPWQKIDPLAIELIKKMMDQDPNQRFSAEMCLKNEWLVQNSEDKKSKMQESTEQKILVSLRTRTEKSELQRAVLTYISTLKVTMQQERELSMLFKKYDQDHNGVLSKTEIIDAFAQVVGEQQAIDLFQEFDLDKNGSLSFTEFIACMVDKRKKLNQQSLEEAFKYLDKDNSKHIQPEELKSIFNQTISSGLDDLVKKIFEESDQNGDGKLSLQEFTQIIDAYVNSEKDKGAQTKN